MRGGGDRSGTDAAMTDLDRRFRDAVQGERRRIASEAAATAAADRMQAQIAARLEEYTAVFQDRERCRFLVPALTRSEYGIFGVTFRPGDEAMGIHARLQDRFREQRRHIPLPQPVTLHIGRFADLSEVSAAAVLDQLAKSFVFHEKSIQDLRAAFSRLEDELNGDDAAQGIPPGSMGLVLGGVGVLVLILLYNLLA